MARKQIIWSRNARFQLQSVLEFYIERNKSNVYSLKLLDQVEDLMLTLSQNEYIGRLTSNKSTRIIPMKVYLVFYEINSDTIEIVSFWDNRQDNEGLNL